MRTREGYLFRGAGLCRGLGLRLCLSYGGGALFSFLLCFLSCFLFFGLALLGRGAFLGSCFRMRLRQRLGLIS